MATVKVIDIIRRLNNVLVDPSATRWTRLELQDWINDAYREIVKMKPTANAVTIDTLLAAGAPQDLTGATINKPSALAVLDITRNTASTSAKRQVTRIDRAVMDTMVSGWRTATAAVDIDHWIPDATRQTAFDVYPPATSLAKVEIIYSELPAAHELTDAQLDPASASNTTVINLDDEYANAIFEFVAHKALMKEIDSDTSLALAAAHWKSFLSAVGADQ